MAASSHVDHADSDQDDTSDGESPASDHSPINVTSPIIQSRIRAFSSRNPMVSDCAENSDSEPESSPCSVQCQSESGQATDVTDDPDFPNDRADVVRRKAACKKNCLDHFADSVIIEHRLNMIELEPESRDMLIMGQLTSCGLSKGDTTRAGFRKRQKFSYQFNNRDICLDCFLFVNNIGIKYLKNLKKHLFAQGPVPRKHGNASRNITTTCTSIL